MFSNPARRWIRRTALVCAAAVTALVGAAAPAHAYSQEVTGYYNAAPHMQFYKNPSSPMNSNLQAFVSVGGVRYWIIQRAGSGNGSTDQCATNAGWLPDGFYTNIDQDPRSHFSFYYRTWGNAVIRGWVWDLGDKQCTSNPNGKYRTELFIHSEGYNGWNDSNYRSSGCIKINQVDRANLAAMWNAAYDKADGGLTV